MAMSLRIASAASVRMAEGGTFGQNWTILGVGIELSEIWTRIGASTELGELWTNIGKFCAKMHPAGVARMPPKHSFA